MSEYRDDLKAAQLRIDTLEDKLDERDRILAERQAKLHGQKAVLRRLRALHRGPRRWSRRRGRAVKSSAIVLSFVLAATAIGAGLAWTSSRSAPGKSAQKAGVAEKQAEQPPVTLPAPAVLLADPSGFLPGRSQTEPKHQTDGLEQRQYARDSANTGQIVVHAHPPAMLLVDGRFYGWTPLQASLQQGEHTVVLIRERQRQTRRVKVHAGRVTRVGSGTAPAAMQ